MNASKIGLVLLFLFSLTSISAAELPTDLAWQTNINSTEWSSEKAVSGGVGLPFEPIFGVQLQEAEQFG